MGNMNQPVVHCFHLILYLLLYSVEACNKATIHEAENIKVGVENYQL